MREEILDRSRKRHVQRLMMRPLSSFAIAMTIACSGAYADEASLRSQLADGRTALPTLQLGTLVRNGRPDNFYRLVLDQRPNVCGPLSQALSKPYVAVTGRGKHPVRDLLLGNDYSIEWDELKSYSGHPVSRADIDLNNDGRLDTVYRVAGMRGGPYLYGLLLTGGHSTAEAVISREREREILGLPLQEPNWGAVHSNSLFFTGPRHMNSNSEPIETIHPPLPSDITLPLEFISDVIGVDNRHYVVLGPAYYLNESPIRLFVFDTRTPRDHSLVCYFESNFDLRKP
jgi:hypothetical protein